MADFSVFSRILTGLIYKPSRVSGRKETVGFRHPERQKQGCEEFFELYYWGVFLGFGAFVGPFGV